MDMASPLRRRRLHTAALTLLAVVTTGPTTGGQQEPARRLPTPVEMASSLRDVWGERALEEPDGPSYEFFEGLLPPLRYVNTAFRNYPVVLSAPAAPVKAR